MSALLQISGLRVAYRGGSGVQEAVRGVDLRLDRGRTLALVGESGSGKTSIGRSVLGLHPRQVRQSGSITLDGRELVGLPAAQWRSIRGRSIAQIPQDPLAGLNPVHPIGRQVAEVLVRQSLARGAAARERAVQALEEAGLEDAARRYGAYPHELSGGQRQRVLIAIAIVARPELIIADEPTSALDVTVQKLILDRLAELTAGAGTSLLLITHDLALAADRADEVAVLADGELVEQLAGQDLLHSARTPAARRLAESAPTLDSSPLVTAAAAPAAERGVPLVAAREVRVTFPGRGIREDVVALDGVSLAVHDRESVGIVGESGSGKSTLARVLLGLQAPTEGRAEVLGFDTATRLDRAERRQVRRAVQPVFQDPYSSFDPLRSIGASIAEPLGALTQIGRRARTRRVAELLDQVRLPASVAARRPRELSGGQLQRAAIARALAVSPRLVVADEAVSALDVSVQDQVLRLLAQLHREQDLALVFISHDLAVVRQVSTRVLVMRAGQVVEEGPTAQVLAHPATEYTQALIDAVPGRTPTRGAV
ncbi:MAG TPA: ABC transporter ATP-binding protein [Candidatus Ruania gallistercoris]|uniref:ABC transporter ATP-binding protein n=1 Tax=Candidatus Ruania gallistercoris TaxID=2838746 RepID=A0A9D2EFX5_9MICO|nr:ABC transporter ATP-binding protein [Candidatus Ruania gallistercoris]